MTLGGSRAKIACIRRHKLGKDPHYSPRFGKGRMAAWVAAAATRRLRDIAVSSCHTYDGPAWAGGAAGEGKERERENGKKRIEEEENEKKRIEGE